MGPKTASVNQPSIETSIQMATTENRVRPTMSTVHENDSTFSSTSSRKRLMASPGDSFIDCAPGSSKMRCRMLRRSSVETRNIKWTSFHIPKMTNPIRPMA